MSLVGNKQWASFRKAMKGAGWTVHGSGVLCWFVKDGAKFYPFNHNPTTGLENWRTFADAGTTPTTGGEL